MSLFFMSTTLDVVFILASLITALYVYLTWNFNYWKKRGIHYLKPVPIFGNVKDYILKGTSTANLVKQFYDAFQDEKFFGCFVFRQPTLFLRDPQLAKDVMIRNLDHFHDRGIPVDDEIHPLSANLFNLSGERWRALRAKLTPTFTSGKMKMMYELILECSEMLQKQLDGPALRGDELEMRDIFAQFTTDVIGTCVFGLQFNAMNNPNSEFRRAGRKAFERSVTSDIRKVMVVFLPKISRFFNITFGGIETDNFFLKVVKETVDYRVKNKITRNDFIQLLIQLRKKEEEMSAEDVAKDEEVNIRMTDNFLAAQAVIFFLAGYETSSTTMAFALYELALHPEMQTKLRKEIDDTEEKHGGKLTYDAIINMSYLDKVISEAMRKYPPGNFIARTCTKPYTIPGTDITVDKGTLVIIPVYAFHHDPNYFPDPQHFDPERFSDENKDRISKYIYMPFGQGPRNCIGQRFGLLESKIGLYTVIKKFKFEPCQSTRIPVQFDTSFVLSAKGGIPLKISHRDS